MRVARKNGERLLARADDLEVYPDLETIRGTGAESDERQDGLDYSEKFAALRRIARHPIPAALEVLVDTLDDPNRRFARMAWKTLGQVSGQELPFESQAWKAWLIETGSATGR